MPKTGTMKKIFSPIAILFTAFFLCLSSLGFAQYDKVDQKVKSYPKFTGAEKLADRINADFTKDDEKARAIFTWTALNIRYDLKAYYLHENGGIAYSYSSPEDKIRKDRKFRLDLTNTTLKSGKAVCEGYASAFIILSELVGLESVLIPGTSKSHHSQIGKLPKTSDHIWNAVKIDGQWELLDITWASGVVNSQTRKFEPRFNDVYFFTDPDKFFLNHFPDDEKWLLTDKTAEDFAALPFYYPQYLQSDYELTADEGHILFPKNVAVKFKIRNLQSNDRVAYITSRDNILDEVMIDSDDSFIIFPSAKLSGYLTIFVNERPLVAYKIVKS